MTAAVCLLCGHIKNGAWVACPGCRHQPKTMEDRARHLIATGHYLKPDKLEAISREIKAGNLPQFLPEQVQAVIGEIERMDNVPEYQNRRLIRKLIPFVILSGFLLFGIAVWFVVHFFT